MKTINGEQTTASRSSDLLRYLQKEQSLVLSTYKTKYCHILKDARKRSITVKVNYHKVVLNVESVSKVKIV